MGVEGQIMTTVQVGDAGELLIPSELCRAVGIEEGSYVVMERIGGGILVRPAGDEPEEYTSERKAEFLLNTAVDSADYAAAVRAVRAMGLDPERVQHARPAGA